MSSVEAAQRNPPESMGLLKAALWLLSLLMLMLALAFGADWLLRTDNFPVQHVRFEGEFKHVTRQELETAVMTVVRGNFFLLNLDAVKRRVESLPWVYKASVRRQWPQDVSVRFVEQQLAARWGESAWLNHVGDVVRVERDAPTGEFPRLEGPDGTGLQMLERYRSLSLILAAAGLKLDRLTLTPRRSWRLALANGVVVVLDREQPEQKLERFARVYARSLAPFAADIKQVDLRYSNGFAVEWSHRRMGNVSPKRIDHG